MVGLGMFVLGIISLYLETDKEKELGVLPS